MSLTSMIRNVETDFKAAVTVVTGWADKLYAALPAQLHPIIDAEVTATKQAISDAASWADAAAKPVLDAAAADIEGSFIQVCAGVGLTLGNLAGAGAAGAAVATEVGRQVQPYEVDTVNRIRDALKAELDVVALKVKGLMAGAVEVVPAPPPGG